MKSVQLAATIVAETNTMAVTTDMIPKNKKIAWAEFDANTPKRRRRRLMSLEGINGPKVRQIETSPAISANATGRRKSMQIH